MSILGLGTDIVDISRFKRLILNHGMKIPNKILSTRELQEYFRSDQKDAFLAKRFTAKEAAAKAMGIGIHKDIFLKSCEVIHYLSGQPTLNMSGYAEIVFNKIQAKKIFLSVTDSSRYAYSIVILEK
ncbi:holo-ACP synthase [Buchnera aphidicola]|uniref:holo-ACP synthase n=1 Tax=Buchnera aphidicola TaxID=9 RepID=UPI00094DA535|nr:holo-ACP synthase [Buchnera aphidicola]